jgi:hypothetical protein
VSAMAQRTGDWVDNTALREAVERRIHEGETLSGICRRLGAKYVRDDNGYADVSRLKRRLGMVRVTSGVKGGKTYPFKTRTIRYDVAVRICEAIDGDPVELGL